MSVIRSVAVVTLFSAATLVHGPAEASTVSPSGSAPTSATTSPASITLSPTTKTITVGSRIVVTVTVNTGDRPVNAIQAFLTFPDANLDCSTYTLGTTFTVEAAHLCNGSQAAIAASIPAGASNFTGTTVVAKFTLTARHTGKVPVGFDRNRTMVADAATNSDILGSWNTSTVTIRR